jgi:3-hydroxyacyl-CoA dehydrogenase/enoyl-CoA hydratase/3-hydroxybutyryl-CoA epimerase
MRLVEIVRGGQTRPEVIDTARAFVRRLGKVPVVVGNAPGFLVNRLLTPYLLEAEKLVAEGFAVRDIDRCMRSAGMPMGPLELIDEIGLDVASLVARTMQDAFGDRFPSAGVVEELRAKGCLGKKSGCGFYDYSGKKRTVHPDVARKARLPLYAERVRLRLVLPVVLEGLRCLDEGVIAHEDAIDLAMQLGTGFLLPEGGPMTWARAQGWQHLMRQCEALEIETPPGLQQRARSLQEANP